MGRPPGGPDGGMRRRYPQDWELRDPRFEELDSDGDDYGNGVVLDPKRDGRGFRGDELYFDGYDIGQARHARRVVYDHADDMDSDGLDYRDQRGRAYQDAVREKEEALYQGALDRIARANAKGKTNVHLSQEELEVYQRRQSQQQRQPVPLVSPPATPAKSASTPKGKVGSRSNSSTSLSNQKTRGKRGSSGIFAASSSSPAKSNSKAKVSRKSSAEQPRPYPTGAQPPPGIMVPGPNGTPVYAPIGYYPPPSPEIIRGGAKARSRSGSKHSRRDSTPPERTDSYAYAPRYYPPSAMRPESAHSNRSMPDDIDWYPPQPALRNRSTSNAGYAAYPDYDVPPLPSSPAAQGSQQRRNVSGPADVRYANLRRVPPSSPLAPRRPEPHAVYSDPVQQQGRRGSLLASRAESSGSSSDDQGVQVDIVADAGGGGYSVNRAPVTRSAGNEGRRRKAGRR